MRSVLARKPGVQVGESFKRLVVLGQPFRVRTGSESRQCVVCQCDCGKVCVARVKSLKNADTKSCGCWNDECRRSATHGHKRRNYNGGSHPLYQVWCEFRRRCRSQNHKRYADYGGRGIVVCREWDEDYEAFHNWAVANGWQRGLCLDRRDNDGPYSPDNCRFVTYAVNNRNKRKYRTSRVCDSDG